MSLAELTPELVAQCLEFVPSSKVLYLWLSGDSRMRRNLVRVLEIELKDDSVDSTSRIPNALTHFRNLERLSISRRAGSLGWKIFPAVLTSLSQLRCLELYLDEMNMEKWCQSLEKPFKEIWPKLEVLKVLHHSPLGLSAMRYKNYPHMPDSLTHLEANTRDATITSWPRNLLVYKFQLIGTISSAALWDDVPEGIPSLTDLVCTFSIITPEIIARLPQSLTSLEFFSPTAEQSLGPLLFPPGLTSLSMKMSDTRCFGRDGALWRMNEMVHLKSLELLPPDYHRSSSLPAITLSPTILSPSLTRLKVSIRLARSASLAVPRKLKILDLQGCEMPFIPISHYIDDTLTNQANEPPLTLEEFYVPSSILRWGDVGDYFPPGELPPSLHALFTTRYRFGPGLTSLLVYGDGGWQTNYMARLHAIPSLTSLTATANYMSPENLAQLPINLTHLSLLIHSRNASWKQFPVGKLPLGLRTLTLEDYMYSIKLKREDFQTFQKMESLEELNIDCNAESINNEDFLLLPRTLRKIRMNGPKRFDSGCFVFLPRYLLHLSLQGLTLANPAHLQNLPRGLRTLQAWSTPLATEHDVVLPTTLPIDIQQSLSSSPMFMVAYKNRLASCEGLDPRVATNSFLSHNNPPIPAIPQKSEASSSSGDLIGIISNFFGSFFSSPNQPPK